MRTQYIVIFFITISLLAGCNISGTTPDKEWELVGTTWWLEAFEDEEGVKSGTGSMYYDISFSDSTWVGGRTWEKNEKRAINSYFSSYYAEPVSIKITAVISTAVGEPSGSRSSEYHLALRNATSYEIEGDRLFIFYGEQGNKTLHFQGR